MTLRIVGAGFGRTGTLSFKAALERLGFGPCYHMLEVPKNEGHAALWHRAVNDAGFDWPSLLSGYRSAVDWPACYFWPRLAEAYPEAKVILTLRDAGKWYDSISKTILPAILTEPTNPARHAMAEEIIMRRTFDGRLDDRDHAIEVYNANTAAVRAAIEPARLLIHDVAEGWAPLCDFLGVPVPDEDYPRVNSTAEFRVMTGLDT